MQQNKILSEHKCLLSIFNGIDKSVVNQNIFLTKVLFSFPLFEIKS